MLTGFSGVYSLSTEEYVYTRQCFSDCNLVHFGSSTEVLNMKCQLSIQSFMNKKANIQKDKQDLPAAQIR